MKILYSFFIILFFISPYVCLGDEADNSLGADSNMEHIHNKQRQENEKQFKDLVVEAKKYLKDFDWTGFEDLPDDAQRIVIQNYLAQEAFQEIGEKFKKDIYERTNNQVEIENYKNNTYYFNSPSNFYRTDHVSKNIMKKAKQQNLLYPTEGTNWFHFKQKDVAKLDKIIQEETAKSPADMHCEKECVNPTNMAKDPEQIQKYLANWKKRLDDYEKNIQKHDEFLVQEAKKLKRETKELKKGERKYGISEAGRRHLENERQFQEEYKQLLDADKLELIQWRKEYDEAVKRLVEDLNVWSLDPYKKDCEMVTFACYNVEQIPKNMEIIQLSTSKEEDNEKINHITYVYDDMDKKQHIESLALKSCNCYNNSNTNMNLSVKCKCSIGFYDNITDFDKYRNYENQDRIDIKNGKLQDRNNDGVFLHDWEGNHIPIGLVEGRSLFQNASITIEKYEK